MDCPELRVDETVAQYVETPRGRALLHRHALPDGIGAVARALLLHGAGASSDTADLLAVAAALGAAGIRVTRLDQPYRVSAAVTGTRRPPPPAAALDAVVGTAVGQLGEDALPLVLVGRSSGARVACRTARTVGARGVVALGFPLRPPGSADPAVRRDELAAAAVPVLVVQGDRDSFGGPEAVTALGLAHVTVHRVTGADHSFAVRRLDGRDRADVLAEVAGAVVRAVTGWVVAARCG